MKNLSQKLILTIVLTACAIIARAQFAGPFAIANWGTVQVNSDGITNTNNAPASITMISGNNQSATNGINDFTITVPQSGHISFNWAYSTGDNPAYDYPQYVLNGVAFPLTTYNTGGYTQSGTETCINVNQGDLFALRMYTGDNLFGPATTTFSNIMILPGSISVTASSASICPGNTLALTATGGTSYAWSSGVVNGVAFAGPASTFTYYVSSFVGTCNLTRVVPITVLPGPNTTVSGNPGTTCSGTTLTLTATGANNYAWSTGSPNDTILVTPLTNTAYTLVSGVGTCTIQTIETVSVNLTPTLTVAGLTVICQGAAAELTVNGASTYTWSNFAQTANVILTPAITTTYNVSGTWYGCSVTAVQAVSVNPLPVVSLSSGSTLVCSGQPIVLIASGASTYSWSNFPFITTDSVAVTPTTIVTYTVIGADDNGCTGKALFTQNVTLCTGIPISPADYLSLQVYPNPASHFITVESEKNTSAIQVIDLRGETVLYQNLPAPKSSIDIQGLNNGIYFIRSIYNNGAPNGFKKLIINR